MVDIDEMLPGRGTKGVIFIIRQLQEKHFAKEKHLYIAFVDLKKEFDCLKGNAVVGHALFGNT